MKFYLIVLGFVFLLGIANPVHAELIDRGNGLLYDDVQDITWMSDASYCADRTTTDPACILGGADFWSGGAMTWYGAMAYADALEFGGFDDWRLPTTMYPDPSCEGSIPNLRNCSGSEMGYIYHVYGISAGELTDGPFMKFGSAPYWSSTEWIPTEAFVFSFFGWPQYTHPSIKTNHKHVMTVRDGDVINPPILDSIGNQSIVEDSNLFFTVTTSDTDGDSVTLSTSGIPVGASFDVNTGQFSWTPGYTDAGSYDVTFTATEDTIDALFAEETITITVTNTNRAPVLDTIGNQTVTEGEMLSFTVTASDPDGDTVTLSATNTPAGSSFDPNTGVFTWNTGYDDAGNYMDVEFTATDDGLPIELAMELITITVGDVNRPPVFVNPGSQPVLEAELLAFTVSATDPDGDGVILSASATPAGSSFNPETGQFSWTPTLSDAGVHIATFVATDTGSPVESATIDVVITVGDNPTPDEQAEDLVEDVVNIPDLPQNIENSYLANLQKVEQFILTGKIQAALNQLNAFIQKLDQDFSQGSIEEPEYSDLREAALSLIFDLT